MKSTVNLSAETEALLRDLAATVKQRAYFRTRDEGGWFWEDVTACFRITDVKKGKTLALSPKDGPLLPIADANGNWVALAMRHSKRGPKPGPKRGEVFCVNHEYDPGERHRAVRIAKSLPELIKQLKPQPDEPKDGGEFTDKQLAILVKSFGMKPTKANIRALLSELGRMDGRR